MIPNAQNLQDCNISEVVRAFSTTLKATSMVPCRLGFFPTLCRSFTFFCVSSDLQCDLQSDFPYRHLYHIEKGGLAESWILCRSRTDMQDRFPSRPLLLGKPFNSTGYCSLLGLAKAKTECFGSWPPVQVQMRSQRIGPFPQLSKLGASVMYEIIYTR